MCVFERLQKIVMEQQNALPAALALSVAFIWVARQPLLF